MSAAAADDPGGAGPSEASLRAVLKKYWGHSDFRPNQLEVVKNVIFGRDVLAFMATGMGKSLTYQLPALALRESAGYKCVGVVVSPLISLMQDQVVGLRSNGRSPSLGGSPRHTSHRASSSPIPSFGHLSIRFNPLRPTHPSVHSSIDPIQNPSKHP